MQVADEHNTPAERPLGPFLLHGTTTCRVQRWSYRGDVAQLVLYLQRALPTVDDLARWCHELGRLGYRAVRTSAVSGEGAARLESAGFQVVQELALLEHTDIARAAASLSGRATRKVTLAERHQAAVVDLAAFGPEWGMDDAGLHDVCAATPRHRIRAAGRPFSGFAVTGRDGRLGFLQRLAVHPDAQGQGLGLALVADSLHWLARWRVQRALVNTPLTNEVALGLYHRVGYRTMPEVLRVYERAVG